jgi:LPS sulfotransferase NodH
VGGAGKFEHPLTAWWRTLPVPPRRSYLICSVQRAGSWLLSHALQDTGVLGIPAEHLHPGDEQFWRSRWGATSEDAFLRALRQEPATANGV